MFFRILYLIVWPLLAYAQDSNPNSSSQKETPMETPSAFHLADYKPPVYLIDNVFLHFDLDESKTQVTSKMHVRKNQLMSDSENSLVLNGEDLQLISVKLNGKALEATNYVLTDTTLTILQVPVSFVLEIQTQINPQSNTKLEGLYKSGTIFCTQNEPEGFRKITYFLDRSDVMAKYTTTIVADQKQYPILLSNGNPIGTGTLENGKHWVKWEDPFPKPSYLFALVAGDLGCILDTFTTMSGRKIDLRIYCDKGNESKCFHAMQSLKKAMKWDEETYGLEYDLDIFMIVAVDAFNMGAMENKGLNIFNTSCVLADPKTATDDNYGRIETVIAHEYFHNWTGNRVTCRDWFQLTLKEGLTVFRDQEFTADMQSRPIQRIDAVLSLRARQFLEDAGPTAHPIKPKSYIAVNNFYTATVYNKGAEVIRMIETMIGHETFCKGITKYFELYDGQAVTTEDFIYAMEKVSGRDFTQFKRWYSQAGTPEIQVHSKYDAENKTFAIDVRQSCVPTADNSEKEPFHFPLLIGLIGKNGQDLPLYRSGKRLERSLIEITKPEEVFVFENVEEAPVLSINRNFSAPIKVHVNYLEDDYFFLMAHDSDPFNRWEAGQKLVTNLLLSMVKDLSEGNDLVLDSRFIEAFGTILKDPHLDMALKAMALILPSEASLAQQQEIIDFDGIHLVREFARLTLAEAFQDAFKEMYSKLNVQKPYHFDSASAGKRSLKTVCLSYLSLLRTPESIALCEKSFASANNMTDQFTALGILSQIDCSEREKALKDFYAQWKHETLVMNKWLAVQATSSLDGTLEAVHGLMKDPIYDNRIPNLVRALIGSFTLNAIHFNRNDGVGYAFLADRIIEEDKLNPQVAAHLALAFANYSKLDPMRKKAMRKELLRIMEEPIISPNVFEIISKALAWEEQKVGLGEDN